MTCRFIDGFDHVDGTTITSYSKWGGSNNISIASDNSIRRFTGDGNYLQMNNFQSTIFRDFGTSDASGIIGLAIRVPASGTNAYNAWPIMLYDGATCQMAVQMNPARTLSLTRGTTILATSTYTFPTDTWFYLELKWRINNSISTNDVILYADGVDILNLTAGTDTQNTSNAFADRLRLHGDGGNTFFNGGAIVMYYDDLYWFDLAGSTNNTPTGPVRVSTLVPTANGNSSQLVNSAGNSTDNFSYVDETSPNGDTDYVETATVGNKDTYVMSDPPASTTTVYAVAINTAGKKTDVGTRTFKNQMRISGTDYEGADTALTTTYRNFQEVVELNPATSSAWTKSVLDAIEIGTKCHS